MPSIETDPASGIETPSSTSSSVLLPDPVGPTMPIDSPGRTSRLTPRKAGAVRVGYLKVTPSTAELVLEAQRGDRGLVRALLVGVDTERVHLPLDEVGRPLVELQRVLEKQDLVEGGQEAKGAGEDKANGRQHRLAAAGEAGRSDDEHRADDE